MLSPVGSRVCPHTYISMPLNTQGNASCLAMSDGLVHSFIWVVVARGTPWGTTIWGFCDLCRDATTTSPVWTHVLNIFSWKIPGRRRCWADGRCSSVHPSLRSEHAPPIPRGISNFLGNVSWSYSEDLPKMTLFSLGDHSSQINKLQQL